VTHPEQHDKSTDDASLYHELEHWHVNTGGRTVHAKRVPGRFRNFRNITNALWLVFFLGPYIRWEGRQGVLFDIPNRQFHFFQITVLPQDIWMLSLLLLVLAMALFAVTSVASRVFCGFFCFQTAWTDVFTWIEERIEGNPGHRHKLDKAPWTAHKIRLKATKHAIWLLISLLTGISFSVWFADAYEYWQSLMSLSLPTVGWVVLAMFLGGTYILAGFLREQTCFWLCPYARIQGVMTDRQTILPTYDRRRGEPRTKLRKEQKADDSTKGDCIDCFQCVQVCPTGVDIRDGQQLGCITCGYCIDVCETVMQKVGRPTGLIRYASLNEIEGKPVRPLWSHPRTLVYIVILSAALGGIFWGLTHMGSLVLKVIPERQPLFVQLSDGSIQNKYIIKVLNKTGQDIPFKVYTEHGIPGHVIVGGDQPMVARHGKDTAYTLFVRAPANAAMKEITPMEFRIESTQKKGVQAEYSTVFNAPKP